MGVKTGPRFDVQDVFVDYPFEDVKFRWDHVGKKVYRKFYGQDAETVIGHDNRLFNDALRFGDEITRSDYYS
jgi:hypothetical protein